MINYIHKMGYNIEISYDNYKEKKENVVLESYLNKLCTASFSTLSGRLIAMKKILNIKQKVPIFINQENILIPLCGLRNEEVFLFNYIALIDYHFLDDCLFLYFSNKERIIKRISRNSFLRIEQIINDITNKM